MQLVKFIKPWRIYSPGDVAGFDSDQAQRLIDGKVAEKSGASSAEALADEGAAAPEPASAGAEDAEIAGSGDVKPVRGSRAK